MPKSRITGHFDQFLNPLTHSKALYITSELLKQSHILSKTYIKQYYQKIYSSLTFVAQKCTKCTQKSYILSYCIFGPPNPQNGPLYYQGSTFRGPYFAKSLHKLVLTENIFISYFCGMEMHKMYPKVVFLVILTYFQTPKPTKWPLILPRKYIQGPVFCQKPT